MLALVAFGCGRASPTPDPVVAPAVPAPAPSASSRPAPPPEADLRFTGACDASAAVPLDEQRFLLVDDEEDVVRIYDPERGGAPLRTLTFTPTLPQSEGKRPEADLEGAARLGDKVFFLASHARRRSGKLDLHRRLFFATGLPNGEDTLPLAGTPYQTLLDDMLAAPSLSGSNLAAAAERAPNEPGGLNCEGLAAAPDGALLIGFRNPRPSDKALVVRLENPEEVLAGQPARLGAAELLELGGLGVTALAAWRGSVLVLGGPSDGTAPFRLFHWRPPAAPVELSAPLDGLFPEALLATDASDRVLVLSDDGATERAGRECKRAEATAKAFRGRWITVTAPVATGN